MLGTVAPEPLNLDSLHPAARRLKYFEEVFTSEHWMMRIYRVLPKPNREPRLRNARRPRGSNRRVARQKQRSPSGEAP